VLLDCGEGTYGQLVRLHGREDAARILVSLEAIWVSHMHADHHAGLRTLLAERARTLRRRALVVSPLLVIAPWRLRAWLAECGSHEELCYTFVELVPTRYGGVAASPNDEVVLGAMSKLGLAELCNVQVEHVSGACGVVLVSHAGWKFVYSGDTRPCEALVRAGENATLLVHEATFASDSLDEAVKRRHSTIDEAAGVAARMGAAHTFLTHFSQRYPKVPEIGKRPASLTGLEPSATRPFTFGVGFDLMRVAFADLPIATALAPALVVLFADEDNEQPAETDGLAGGADHCTVEL
jgi:ribonuclease Z